MPSRIAGGQVTISGTAQRLTATPTPVETLLIKAHSTNSASVYLGESGVTTSTGYPISPGEEFVFTPSNGGLQKMPNPNELYVVGTSSDKVSWLGTRR